jgi:RNA polymerase sigma-70 factor, ECF subfamily
VQMATAAGRASPLDFDEVFGDLYPALVRRLALVVGDAEEAKDLAQTTYLRAYQHLHQFDGRDARAWLYTIGLRLAFRERTRRQRWRLLVRSGPGPEPWQPAHDPALWDALRGLRREERAALLLHTVDGYTLAEVAEMLGVPPGTVGSWVSRARARLREQLGRG